MDKGIPGPGVLAQLITSKYADHVPLYRQQQIYRRFGLEIPRSTMCGWVSYVAELLAPILEAMKQSVMTSRKVHTDGRMRGGSSSTRSRRMAPKPDASSS